MTCRRPLLVVLSGPSGCGKTTLACDLLERHGGTGGTLQRSISVTTRPPRPGEVNGADYFFVSEAQFAAMASRNEFLETALLYGHRYGTPRKHVEAHLKQGADVLLVLDAEGRRKLAATHGPGLVSVFLLPPSLAELKRRLTGRGQDDELTIATRLEAARQEIARSQAYDYMLVNRDHAATLAVLDSILAAERLRRLRPALTPS